MANGILRNVSRALLFLGGISLLLVTVTVFRAAVYFRPPPPPLPCTSDASHESIKESDDLLRRFSDAIKFKTITTARQKYDREELNNYIDFIIKSN